MTDRPTSPPDGWSAEATSIHADTPFSALVPGFDAIADLPVPYSRLPRRAQTALGADCPRWSDLAAQTPRTLLSRPKLGQATVQALLTAAIDIVTRLRTAAEPHDAAEAVQRLLDRLDDRDRVLLATRMWAQHKPSRVSVADRLGVHLAWVERNQPKAEARFRDALADPAHREVTRHAAELRRRLGPYLPQSVLDAELRRLDLEPSSDAASLLLYLAGPYTCDEQWCENTTTGGRRRVEAALNTALDRFPTPGATLSGALADAGMAADHADTYLQAQPELRRFGNVWVRWSGSAADKAETVLEVRNAPADAKDIAAMIGDGLALRTVREALSADDRFVRTSRHAWALRRWDLPEYGGIADEITTQIDAAGGSIRISDLVDLLTLRFPDVAADSIRTYLNTLAFVTEEETVRRRTDADGWPPVRPLNTARGAFRLGDNEIRYAIPVTAQLLRGSAQPVHPAVATALGVPPGASRRFHSPHGAVTIMWRLSSTNGPNTSSLRAHANATGPDPGGTLLLAFDLRSAALEVTSIHEQVSGADRLHQILGRDLTNPRRPLAAALDCAPADVEAVLRARGDHDLADILE